MKQAELMMCRTLKWNKTAFALVTALSLKFIGINKWPRALLLLFRHDLFSIGCSSKQFLFCNICIATNYWQQNEHVQYCIFMFHLQKVRIIMTEILTFELCALDTITTEGAFSIEWIHMFYFRMPPTLKFVQWTCQLIEAIDHCKVLDAAITWDTPVLMTCIWVRIRMRFVDV